MKEKLALLVRLQAIDLKRQKDKDALKDFPEKMAISEKPLLDAKAEIDESRKKLEDLIKARKEKELALQITEDRIVKLKLRLTSLKTNKEYHAHLQEIAAARKDKSEAEDFLLITMEDIDLLKKATSEKELVLSENEASFSETRKKMQAEIDRISSAAEAVEAEWQTISEKIPKDILTSYKRLFTSCKGVAVVPVNGHTCTGCHFSLPPQLIAEVKMQGKILTCGYCHRILYVQPS